MQLFLAEDRVPDGGEFGGDKLVEGGVGAVRKVGGKVDQFFKDGFGRFAAGRNTHDLETEFVLRVFDSGHEQVVVEPLVQEPLLGNDMSSHGNLRWLEESYSGFQRLESWFSNLWKTARVHPVHEDLKGLVVPVLTPFMDSGEIDQRAFVRHLEFLSQNGIRRIMVNGTTAEFYSLLPDERKLMLKLARNSFPGFIVLHAGGCGLAQNRLEVQWANELGADAVAALPPIYPAGLPAAGIIAYFRALSDETDLPFILYNFPKHTGNAITPEILKAVPHHALKDSAQNLELMEHTPRYLIGSSTNIFAPIQQGAAGFVAATANVRPELYADFEMLLSASRPEEADIMQEEIRAYSAPFSAGGIPMLKQALARELPGYPVNVRIPLGTAAG